jgi:hypothetical protein
MEGAMSSIRLNALVRYGAPGLLLGLMLAWMLGAGRVGEVRADPPRSADANTGMIAFTSAGPAATQLLYLIDTRNQAFAIYRVDPQNSKGTVKLEAARLYRSDLRLAEYNNLPPEVAAIESMVRSAK